MSAAPFDHDNYTSDDEDIAWVTEVQLQLTSDVERMAFDIYLTLKPEEWSETQNTAIKNLIAAHPHLFQTELSTIAGSSHGVASSIQSPAAVMGMRPGSTSSVKPPLWTPRPSYRATMPSPLAQTQRRGESQAPLSDGNQSVGHLHSNAEAPMIAAHRAGLLSPAKIAVAKTSQGRNLSALPSRPTTLVQRLQTLQSPPLRQQLHRQAQSLGQAQQQEHSHQQQLGEEFSIDKDTALKTMHSLAIALVHGDSRDEEFRGARTISDIDPTVMKQAIARHYARVDELRTMWKDVMRHAIGVEAEFRQEEQRLEALIEAAAMVMKLSEQEAAGQSGG